MHLKTLKFIRLGFDWNSVSKGYLSFKVDVIRKVMRLVLEK